MALSTRVEASVASRAATSAACVPHRPVTPAVQAPPEVRVLLSVPRLNGHEQYEHLLPDEDIQDVRLRLRNRGWYATSRQCLVFGDRELAEQVKAHNIAAKAAPAMGCTNGSHQPGCLHVFVKLADIDQVDMRTLKREVSLTNAMWQARCSSAPGSDSASSSSGAAAANVSEAVKEVEPSALPLVCPPGLAGSAVVHLMVHRSARVNWHHMGEDAFELSISTGDTVESLMRKLEAAHGTALDADKHSVLFDGQVLAAGQPLAQYGVGTGSMLELVPHEPPASGDEALPDGSPLLSSPAHMLHEHWQRARAGLAGGLSPQLAPAGTGGSYFLHDVDGERVAVFKPEDEEPLAINNPKQHRGSSGGGSEGLRRGTRPGEGAAREVAAWVLDHGHFSGVPPTALVSCYVNQPSGGTVKVGSLQQFVASEGDCEERGVSQFPAQEVHKVAILDMRLGNTDRNASNILACKQTASGGGGSEWRLVPIDHGYCLPASFEDLSFEWQYWPQAEQPFSEESLAYIAALDAEADISILKAHGVHLRPECLRVFRVCNLVLKKGAAAGLTPSQIAGIMCREATGASVLERLSATALMLARAAAAGGSRVTPGCLAGDGGCPVEEKVYLSHMEALLDEYLEQFVLEPRDLLF